MDDHTLLTTEECARLLRVSPRTARRWVRDGILPHVRVSRRLLVPARHVRALIELPEAVKTAE